MTSRRGLLAFVFTVTLTGILNNTLITPALPDILAEFNQPNARAGWLVATGSVAGILVAPLVGVLADRYGRRVVLTSCLTIFATFGALAALAPTFEVLLVARLLQGVGSAGLINLAVVLLGDRFEGAERTFWVGRNGAVLTVGLAAMPSLSGVLTEAFSWRVTFGLYTLAFVTAAMAWRLLDHERPHDPPAVSDQLADVAAVVRRPQVAVILVIGFVVFTIIFGAFLTVMPVHLKEAFGLEAGARGLVISTPAITSSLLSFNLGRVRQRLSVRRLVIVAGCVFAVGFLVMGLAGTVWILVAGTLGYGASEGVFIGSLQDESMALAPDGHRAAVVSAWVGSARLGQTVGPLVFSAILGATSTGKALLVAAGLSVTIMALGLFGPLGRASQGSEPGDAPAPATA